ncbi:MAG: Hpt domain-containing protein [Rubrivivax sp.]|nr:Hpt domain-containing protein [Rubrivivax sp.]
MTSATPQPASAAQALDEGALARLRELDPDGQRGVVSRVLTAYETALLRQLDQLREHLPAPRTDALAMLAHTLKSSSASVGALALARACEALEQRVRQGAQAQTHDVAELLALGEAALAAARTILRR